MEKLDSKYFDRSPKVVARELLGKLLVRRMGSQVIIGKVVETEAYLSKNDRGSHAYRGETKRNEPMYGPAGQAYVYFTYGIHWLLNVVTEKEDVPSAVLLRALEILYDSRVREGNIPERAASGPAKLTKYLDITGRENRLDVTKSDELFFANSIVVGKNLFLADKLGAAKIVKAARVGIDTAGEHKDLPLRYYIKENSFISRD